MRVPQWPYGAFCKSVFPPENTATSVFGGSCLLSHPLLMALSRSQAQHTPLKRMLISICALAQGRFELIGIELAEARARLLTFIFISLAAILLGTMALVTLTVLIAVMFWQTYRWQALAALIMAYLGAMMFCVLKLRAQARKAPPLFETTKAEFRKDREMLSESYRAFVDE